jgi:formylglycine-generating enzyme required for sulfatase activity
MNRLPYLWVALVLLCISACTRTEQFAEQSAAPEADQTQDLPSFPTIEQKTGADHLGIPVQITNSIGIKLNLIPPGEFIMGSPVSEPERVVDETQHLVRITRPFYLSVHEVTQAQYEQVMGKNPSYFSALGNGKDRVSGVDTSQFPVEQVSWNDAVAFCSKLSNEEGVEYRLPPATTNIRKTVSAFLRFRLARTYPLSR